MNEQIVVTRTGLATQLEAWKREGLTASSFSPLSAPGLSERLTEWKGAPPSPPPEDPVMRESLQEAGPVLANPAVTFTLRTGGGFRSLEEEVVCFSEGHPPFGLLLDGADAVVVRYTDENAVLDGYVGRHASRSEMDAPNLIPPLTDPAALLFLFHAIDMYRRSYYASMLACQPQGRPGVALEVYRKDLEQVLKARDARWLVGSLLLLMPAFPLPAVAGDPAAVLMDAGFCDLVQDAQGKPWLAFTEAGVAMGTEFERTWLGSAGFTWRAMSGDRTGVVQTGYLAPTSLANHVVMPAGTPAAPQINHQLFRAIQLKTLWAEALQACRERVRNGWPASEVSAPSGNRFCAYCGQRIETGSRFCDHCGKPVL